MTKLESLKEDFDKAQKNLGEVLQEPKTDIVRDAAIQRFEIVFDLAWKTLKAFVEERHNSTCESPRSCFREGFRLGLIGYDDYWIDLTSMRNYTVHTYSEILAEQIYKDLPRALETFTKLAQALKESKD